MSDVTEVNQEALVVLMARLDALRARYRELLAKDFEALERTVESKESIPGGVWYILPYEPEKRRLKVMIRELEGDVSVLRDAISANNQPLASDNVENARRWLTTPVTAENTASKNKKRGLGPAQSAVRQTNSKYQNERLQVETFHDKFLEKYRKEKKTKPDKSFPTAADVRRAAKKALPDLKTITESTLRNWIEPRHKEAKTKDQRPSQ